jgi:hypothetical protein
MSTVRQSPEMTVFTDAVTGRTIQRLTHSAMDDKHSYYDISPFSPNGRQLLFSAAYPADLTEVHNDTLATNKGQVYVMDTATYALRLLADHTFYNSHTGSFALWHPLEPKVYFFLAPHQVGVVDANSGELLHQFEGGIRQLSPDGELLTWPVNEATAQMERGIYTINEDGSNLQLIASTAALYNLTPNNHLFSVEQMTVGNTKWTPDGRHMLVAMWVKSHPNDLSPWLSRPRRSLYIVSRDGSEQRWLTYFGHHHSWTANGGSVLFSGYLDYADDGTRGRPRLFLVDFDGGNQRIVIDEPLGGHPIASPDGSKITTWDDKGVVLVDINAQRVDYLAMLDPSFDQSHRGTHPHCVWNHDGTQILYNSAQTGTSQLYLIPV